MAKNEASGRQAGDEDQARPAARPAALGAVQGAAQDAAAGLARDLKTVVDFALSYHGFVESRVVGCHEIVERLFLAFLCEGNVLLEGAPGLGKTRLAKTWAEYFGLAFRRVQFTPDLMPLDIIGSSILSAEGAREGGYRFYKGPIFTNVVLGDEINRATPKTQSAFLEAMEEKRVTFLGDTMDLPSPFFVVATQNPIELEGTYPLPEAQIDRFLMRLFFKTPDFGTLKEILRAVERPGIGEAAGLAATMEAIEAYRRAAPLVLVPESVENFILRLVIQTQPEKSDVEAVRKYVRYGASPRCALGLYRAARARAVVAGRPNVAFEDAEALFADLANHRVILNFEAEADGVGIDDVLKAVLSAVRREYRGAA
jgi:MoxR-like ATPase